jgi:hypothetical protein
MKKEEGKDEMKDEVREEKKEKRKASDQKPGSHRSQEKAVTA